MVVFVQQPPNPDPNHNKKTMALCNRFSFLRQRSQPFGVWHPICLFRFCDTFLPSTPQRSWNCCVLHICFSFEANGFENPVPALETTGDTLGCCKTDSGNHWSDRRKKGAGKTGVSASSRAAALLTPTSRWEQVKSSLQDSPPFTGCSRVAHTAVSKGPCNPESRDQWFYTQH